MNTLDNPHGLHIEVAGTGAPLVLLHGWAMHGGVFAALRERLLIECALLRRAPLNQP